MTFWPALGLMAVSFAILAKCADWLVDGAIGIARRLHVPPMLIGIVLVSVGTTSPELAVSVGAALDGRPEIALGNAVGSVIYDDTIALPLTVLLAPAAIRIDRKVLRSSAIFLITIDVAAYLMAMDGTLSRVEGGVLVLGFVVYLSYLYWDRRRSGPAEAGVDEQDGEGEMSWGKILLLFTGGLVGVLVSSHWIVKAAPVVAAALGVPDLIIGLTMIALGTSIPEIATCIIAARKSQGSLAVGNILGADILNICWIAGASAVANPMTVSLNIINFIFPSMLVVVLTMLTLMRMGYQLEKWKGWVLMALCPIYLFLLFSTGIASEVITEVH